MPIVRVLRTPLLQLFRVGFVFAFLGLVAGLGYDDPDKLIWDAILRFFIHLVGAMAIAAPILGAVVIYRRVRLRRLSARLKREFGA
jgi:hypothetical protein